MADRRGDAQPRRQRLPHQAQTRNRRITVSCAYDWSARLPEGHQIETADISFVEIGGLALVSHLVDAKFSTFIVAGGTTAGAIELRAQIPNGEQIGVRILLPSVA